MWKVVSAIGMCALLLVQPANVSACQGPSTYDFAEPGAKWRPKGSGDPDFFIGRVTAVRSDSEVANRLLVEIEVLKDYTAFARFGTTVSATASTFHCGPSINAGDVAKFGVVLANGHLALMGSPRGF